jgi:hypothetical protein
MEWRSQQHRKHNVVAPWSTKTLSRVMECICSVGMNPRAAADWSARLVTVSVVTTLPIDLSEVAYIAIDPPSPPGGSETGFLHKISVYRQRLCKKPGFFCLGKGRSRGVRNRVFA